MTLLADQAAAIDEIAESHQDTWSQDVVRALNDPAERDIAIWASAWEELLEPLGIIELEDFLMTTNIEYAQRPQDPVRNLVWGVAVAAAQQQANVAVVRQVLAEAEKQAVELVKANEELDRRDLELASLEGIGNARFQAAKERRASNGQSTATT